jgi:uncharacterized protein
MAVKRDDDFFWEGIDEGRLLAQCCSGCGKLRHPPRPMCPHCQSLESASVALSGKGKIYSWLISKHPTQPDAEPRTVVLLDMAEGTRLVGNMLADETVKVGDHVTFAVGEFHGMRLPMFTTKGA